MLQQVLALAHDCLHSVHLKNTLLLNLWGSFPEIIEISRRMLFPSSSRQWESVLYTLFSELPHKEKSSVLCVHSFSNFVALRADLSETLVS